MAERAFGDVVERMAKYMGQLRNSELLKRGLVGKRDYLPEKLPTAGIYVFYERCKALYVGRSDNLLDRIRTHGNGGSRKSQAAFASNIAKGEIIEDFMADYEKKYPDACKSDKEWRNALNWELAKKIASSAGRLRLNSRRPKSVCVKWVFGS